MLGWNVHIYHSHLDVHPPILQRQPFRYEWHQDGGRQNCETNPRPRLTVKTVRADSGDDPDVDDVDRCRLIIDFVQDPDVACVQPVDACCTHATAPSGYG